MNDKYLAIKKIGLVLVLACLLNACASTVTVTGEVPKPLIDKLPLQAQIIYAEEFQRYSYDEEEKGRGLRSIAFGAAQVNLFDSIFGALLNIVDLESTEQDIDMTITPTLLEFQYTVPRESRLNLYEIWLKYRLQITGDNNQEIADWVVKGYGKTPTGLLSSSDEAFNSATNIALRDVGAQLAIGFTSQPLIEDYLKTRLNNPSLQNSHTNADTGSESNSLELAE